MDFDAGERAVAAYDAIFAALDELDTLPLEALPTPAQLNLLERRERVARRLAVTGHRLINQIDEHASAGEIGGALGAVMADRLHITRAEAAARIRDAQMLGPRSTFTGEPLAPLWPATAAAQAAGEIGASHIKEIRRFFQQLPGWVDESTKEQAEAGLASLARLFRPDELRRAANALADAINPDGNFSDDDRAQRRGLSIGCQGEDGMSPISGYLTPEARAGLETVLSKWAAPGMCNPQDPAPTVDGPPSDEAITHDDRSRDQRNHDALNALCRAMLASGQLGSHHGLPVSIVVRTTLAELQAGAGKAHTGSGSWLPMRDVIRMASHAYHYLTVFKNHKNLPLYLGRSKRVASPAQRIVLGLIDGGCSFPDCPVPPDKCEVHHITPWAKGGRTDITELTLTCGPNHQLAEQGWQTRKTANGTTEWKPPPHLDHGQRRTNNYHHPQRYLTHLNNNNDDQDDDEHDDPKA